MKYLIPFAAGDAKRFALFYSAFVIGGNNVTGERKDMERLRREAAILDLLWAISTTVGEDAHARTLNAGPQSITLDKPQYDLAKKYLESFVGVVTTSASHEALALIDWFDAIAPSESLKVVKGKK